MNANEWPEYLMLRDTGLHDDMGGLGQRIFTTAGAGYVKTKYIRADLATPPHPVSRAWQPIETVPNKQWIVVRGGAAFKGQTCFVIRDAERMDGSRRHLFTGNAWTTCVTKDRDTWPTHWMPLPPPSCEAQP